MSEPSRFFRWIYRLLGIGGLCLLLAIGYMIIAGEISSRRWQQRDTVTMEKTTADGSKVEETLRFGDVAAIRGSPMRMIKVESQLERGARLGLSSGGYGWNFRTRNLVFLPANGVAAKWLFKDNEQYFGEVEQLCVCADGVKSPTLALYFEIAHGDGDRRPGVVLPAATRVDGSGYTPLGTPVARVLDKDVSEDGMVLGLLVEDNGKLLYRQFSLPDFAPVSEQLVTQLQRK
ncbi:MAG: hypothetical protein ABI858_01925 [Pseudoxanthomonas sp.]